MRNALKDHWIVDVSRVYAPSGGLYNNVVAHHPDKGSIVLESTNRSSVTAISLVGDRLLCASGGVIWDILTGMPIDQQPSEKTGQIYGIGMYKDRIVALRLNDHQNVQVYYPDRNEEIATLGKKQLNNPNFPSLAINEDEGIIHVAAGGNIATITEKNGEFTIDKLIKHLGGRVLLASGSKVYAIHNGNNHHDYDRTMVLDLSSMTIVNSWLATDKNRDWPSSGKEVFYGRPQGATMAGENLVVQIHDGYGAGLVVVPMQNPQPELVHYDPHGKNGVYEPRNVLAAVRTEIMGGILAARGIDISSLAPAGNGKNGSLADTKPLEELVRA